MHRFQRFLEHLHEYKICNDFDRIIPVVGDEGAGKSTLILEAIWKWEEIRGNEPTPQTVLDRVVFDSRDAFRDELVEAGPADPIAAMDAAHILYKKETMSPAQIETERSLLDVRIENYVIFLGYQDWGDIPDQLQRRRAKNVIRVPKRGYVYGYNRDQLDEKYHDLAANEWPDPALKDTFPSLEGTDLWERFSEIDAERKRSRLQPDEEEEDSLTPQEVVEEILANDIDYFVEINEFQERAYISTPAIKYRFPDLSTSEAEQVKAALSREVDVADYVEE